MRTCFLFADFFDEEKCLSIALDEAGHAYAPLIRRTVDELRSLQVNTKTIIVLPTKLGGLYEVELPWLADSKSRQAIPFALEDQLAEPVTSVHFAYDREHYQQHRYLVAVIEKKVIRDLLAKLERFEIDFDAMTLDWFALEYGEAALIESQLLVNNATFKGSVSIELLSHYLKQQTEYTHILTFTDNPPIEHADKFTFIDCRAYHWIALRLLNHKYINFFQDEFQHHTNQRQTKRWYQLAALMGITSVFVTLIMNTIMLIILKNKVTGYETKIAAIYHQFFPESHQVMSPKFRINQLITQSQSGVDEILWPLLAKLGEVDFLKESLQHLHFQNHVLSVTFVCQDFAELEQLQTRLQSKQVKVHQAGAAKAGKEVIATLELTL